MSCCARGGSWFKNCGRAGNTRLHHTWYEGIQACKAWSQSRTAVGHQENAAQQKDIDSSHGDGKVITAAEPLKTSSANMSTSIINTISRFVSRSVSTSTVYATPTKHPKVIAGVTITIITMSANMSTPPSTITSVSTSATEQRCENIVDIGLHVILFMHIIIIVFRY